MPARFELAAEKSEHLRKLRLFAHGRDDFPAVRRHFIDDRHVEVAVNSHRERARNGRRGHDEDIRRGLAHGKAGALRHTELMLFVDHHEAEVLERDAFVKQRVRPDDDVRRVVVTTTRDARGPKIQQRQRSALFLARSGAKGDPHSQWLEPAAKNGVMLLGQYLRRGHKRGLKTGFDRQKHRRDRHDGFAGTDVALKQAIHGMFTRKIAPQFFDHAHLRIREIERQTAEKFLHQRAVTAMRLSAPQRRGRAPRRDQHLHAEKFGEDKMLAGRGELRLVRGKMNFVQGVAA